MEKKTIPYEKQMFYCIKSVAKRKGLAFNLEPSDIKIPSRCPVLGIRLRTVSGKLCENTPCVTRIDNARGYTVDNIDVVSNKALILLSRFTSEDIEMALDYYKKKGY